VPVLKAHDERQGQARLDHFLTFSQRFAKIKSKRLQVRCVRVWQRWPSPSNVWDMTGIFIGVGRGNLASLPSEPLRLRMWDRACYPARDGGAGL
jgi:hypothetical protein